MRTKTIWAVIASWTMTLTLLTVTPSAIHAQEAIVVEKYVQEFSPNAAELGKYGKVPVSYFNGLPDIKVPLYELKARNYTLPVYLTYYAGGHRTEQHPGWVGLGWTLHAGGCINRIINGYKDEMTYQELRSDYPGILDSTPGYFDRMSEVNTSDWMDSSVLQGAFSATLARDRMPDEFQVNIEDIHASFFFVGENDVKIVSKTPADFTVECFLNDGELHQSEGYPGSLVMYRSQSDTSITFKAHLYRYIEKMIITNKDGTKYHFGGDKSAIEFSIRQRYNYAAVQYDPSAHQWNAVGTANTWMLTKIERPDGEEIAFTYEKSGIPIVRRQYHRIMEFDEVVYTNQNDMNHYVFWNTFTEMSRGVRVPYLGISYTFMMPSYLKRISCKDSTDYINIITATTSELEYGFDETEFEHLVGRFSDGTRPFPPSYMKSQSWYKKISAINTPRCSYSFIYSNPSSARLRLGEVRCYMGPGIRVSSYKMVYNSTTLPPYGTRKSDVWGFYNGIDQPVSAADTSGINVRCLNTNETLAQAEMLTRLYYPTGGYTDFEYELHRISKKATQYPFSLSPAFQNVGGLRIKKITDYPSTGTSRVRTYSYEISPNYSSGILSGDPRCHIEGILTRQAGLFSQTVYDNYKIYEDVPITPLSSTDGNHVTYSTVRETFGDGSYCIYRYSNHDTTGCLDTLSFNSVGTITGRMFGDTYTSRELMRGLLLSQEEYSSEGVLVKKTVNEYNNDETKYIPSVSCTSMSGSFEIFFRMNYDRIFCYYPYLKKQTITTWPDSGSGNSVETVTYIYNSHKDQRSVKRQNGTSSIENKVFYSGDLSGSICTTMKQHGIMNYPVESQVIRNNSLVSSDLVIYRQQNGIFVPSAIYEAALGSGTSPNDFSCSDGNTRDARYNIIFDYEEYDQYGNPTLFKDKKGVRTSIEWGYNGMYPINLKYNAFSSRYLQYTCTYHPVFGLSSVTDSRGVTTYYDYDYMGRLIDIKDNNGNYTDKYEYSYKTSNEQMSGYNYIKSILPLSPSQDSSAVIVNYYNGLGEQMQKVSVGASPMGGSIYEVTQYDETGHPYRQWLPIHVPGNGIAPLSIMINYAFDTYSASHAYFMRTYKDVPEGRLVSVRGPGQAWHASGRKDSLSFQIGHPSYTSTRVTKYSVGYNSSGTITISRTGYGSVGEHTIQVSTDEDGHVIREFKDISGNTIQIIKENQSGQNTDYLITVYVRDNAGRITAVLPPLLVDCLTSGSSWSSDSLNAILDYGYYYRYDSKGRMIAKKLPGADWFYYIYDKSDRLIMTQDGNQRTRGEWSFSIEDQLGRRCLEGVCHNEIDPMESPISSHNVYVTRSSTNNSIYGYKINGVSLVSPVINVVNWWDDYVFSFGLGSEANYDSAFQVSTYGDQPFVSSSRGLKTAWLVKTLGEENENHYLWNVCWYDDKARPVQTVRSTAIGDVIRESFSYDYTGNVVKKSVKHSLFDSSNLTESYSYSYDNLGRPLLTSLSLNGGTPVILHDYGYDAVGRLNRDRQQDASGSIISTIDYNIRSWVTSKIVTTSAQDTLFRQNLYYESIPVQSGGSPRWNGALSINTWRLAASSLDEKYIYAYDGLGRLTNAQYLNGDISVANNDRTYQYDKHGNIISSIMSQPYSCTYSGNQLASRANTSSPASSVMSRIYYSYDNNGNRTMSRQFQQPVSYAPTVTYNLLNLPSGKTSFNEVSSYVYSADGEKLSREWARNVPGQPLESHKMDYSGNLVYVDSTLTAVLVDGGYFLMTGATPSFHVFVKDYQGNVSLDTRLDGTEMSSYNYDPYGELIATSTPTGATYENPYRYCGKEWDTSLDCYDFGARCFSPGVIPSWTTMDPFSEKYYDISPYSYCAGDPVNLVDPDGRDWIYNMSNYQYIWNDYVTAQDQTPEGYEYVGGSSNDILRHAGFHNTTQTQSTKTSGVIMNDTDMITMVKSWNYSSVIVNALIDHSDDMINDSNKSGKVFNGIEVIVNESISIVSNSDEVEAFFKASLKYARNEYEVMMSIPMYPYIASGEINKTGRFIIPSNSVKKPMFGYSGAEISVTGLLGINSYGGFAPMVNNVLKPTVKTIRHNYHL